MRDCTWEKEVDRGSHRGGDSGLSARHPDCPLSFLCNGTQSSVSPALLARELNNCANVDHSVHLSFPIATDRRQRIYHSPLRNVKYLDGMALRPGSYVHGVLRLREQRLTFLQEKRARHWVDSVKGIPFHEPRCMFPILVHILDLLPF